MSNVFSAPRVSMLALSALLGLVLWSRGSQTTAGTAEPGLPAMDFAGHTMGTTFSVQCAAPPGGITAGEIRNTAAGVQALLDDLDGKMSTYRPDSELMRLNAAPARQWLPVSPDLFEVLEAASRWGRESGGAFDVSAGALVNLWGFGPASAPFAEPPSAAIQEVLRDVGLDRVELAASPPSLRKTRPAVFLDLSGIAKGYAVQRVADRLAALGLTRCLVEIGGELAGRGRNHQGEVWTVGIEDPAGGPPRHRVALSGVGVATSGNYRLFASRGGRRWAHVIDPREGRPVNHDLVSVTVIHSSVTAADAWATALLVLGPEPGFEFAERAGLAALFLEGEADRLRERVTPEFRAYLVCEKVCPHD